MATPYDCTVTIHVDGEPLPGFQEFAAAPVHGRFANALRKGIEAHLQQECARELRNADRGHDGRIHADRIHADRIHGGGSLTITADAYERFRRDWLGTPHHHTQKADRTMMALDERTKARLLDNGAAFADVDEDGLEAKTKEGGWAIISSRLVRVATGPAGVHIETTRYVLARVNEHGEVRRLQNLVDRERDRANEAAMEAHEQRRVSRVAADDTARHLREKEEQAKDLAAVRTERDGLLQTVSALRQTIKLQDEAGAARERDHTAALTKAQATRKPATRRRRKRAKAKPAPIEVTAKPKRVRKGKA